MGSVNVHSMRVRESAESFPRTKLRSVGNICEFARSMREAKLRHVWVGGLRKQGAADHLRVQIAVNNACVAAVRTD